MTKKSTIVLIRNAASKDFGGGERFPVFLAEVLQRQDFVPIVLSHHEKLLQFARSRQIATKQTWWWQRQNWSGKCALLFPIYLVWQVILFCYYLIIFAKYSPEVVHIQSKDDFIAATFAAKIIRTRVIWTDHADLKHIWKNLTKPFKNPVGKFVYLAAKYADHITVVSNSELKEVTRHLHPSSPVRNKLSVVYNGCADVLASYPSTRDPSITRYVIANRLVTDKGIGETIEAFIRLHKLHQDTVLLILGDGPEANVFKKQAAQHPAITFAGHQDDPYAAIRQADIFLQPTYHEGFSVVLVEASMLEMPIIATSVGGNVEIIADKKTGLLVPAKDSRALFGAMAQLYADASLRKKLAKNARVQYLDRFVFDDIVKKHFIPFYRGEK